MGPFGGYNIENFVEDGRLRIAPTEKFSKFETYGISKFKEMKDVE